MLHFPDDNNCVAFRSLSLFSALVIRCCSSSCCSWSRALSLKLCTAAISTEKLAGEFAERMAVPASHHLGGLRPLHEHLRRVQLCPVPDHANFVRIEPQLQRRCGEVGNVKNPHAHAQSLLVQGEVVSLMAACFHHFPLFAIEQGKSAPRGLR
eukprot:1478149-Pleurochrysis_carterae.AAC.1